MPAKVTLISSFVDEIIYSTSRLSAVRETQSWWVSQVELKTEDRLDRSSIRVRNPRLLIDLLHCTLHRKNELHIVSDHVRTGLENFIKSPPPEIVSSRFGLLMNQASVDRNYRYSCDALAERFPEQLVALFSPQHGFWGEEQANMIESADSRYEPLDLPVYSLYSETRRPTAEMLEEIDCLVIDLQDVGTRVYTFLWTTLECLRACAEHNVRVVVLDRPNPLGGEIFEGPMLQDGFQSFVGNAEIPLRHGLTLGEFAMFINKKENIGANLSVIPMTNWQRAMHFHETGVPWASPSPNMPSLSTATLYPGQVLLEGTNLSEGRGTTMPFEFCGAPYLNAEEFTTEVARHNHPGIQLRPIRFRPTFDKWQDEICNGLAIHITDPHAVRSVPLTVSIIDAAKRLAPNEFQWLNPPYEYEDKIPPIDILFGNAQLRKRIDQQEPIDSTELNTLCAFNIARWQKEISPFLLY